MHGLCSTLVDEMGKALNSLSAKALKEALSSM